VRFPGGHSKFAVRLHEPSGYYVALSNGVSREAGTDFFPGCFATSAAARLVRDTLDGLEEHPMKCCTVSHWRKCPPTPCVWCRGESRSRLWLLVSRDLLQWRPVEELVSDRSSLRGSWMSDLLTVFASPNFVFDGANGEKLVAAVHAEHGDASGITRGADIRIVRARWLEATLRSAPGGESSDCSLTAAGGVSCLL
jgi:hypothetical protein